MALGNPGPKYAGTRHNVGVMALEEILERFNATLTSHKRTNTEVAEISGSRKLILARTREYMNLSGGPVKSLASYFGVALGDIVVIHDELELDFAAVRLRLGGGDHGHNGLKSVTKSLGTSNYQRLSLGIGRPPGRMDPAAFVLKPFSKAELTEVPIMCADAADELENLLT